MAEKTTQNMSGFILAIIIVGLTLVIGIYVASTMSTSFYTRNQAATVINETGAFVNGTGYTLGQAGVLEFSAPIITQVINSSGTLIVPSGNYTLVGNVLYNKTAFNSGSVNVSYTYTYSEFSSASNASDGLVSALSGGSAWITILVVVGFAVIVLGMLSEGLGKVASGASQGAYTY